MRFGNPAAFWLLLLLPGLVTFFVWSQRRRLRDLARFGNPLLLEKLTRSRSLRKRNAKLIMLVVAVLFIVLALSRPQWGTKIETVQRRGLDIVIALDTSLSMMTDDIKPSRLVRARAEISSMLERFGAVDYARDQAARYARQARVCLTPLRMSPARERLEALAEFVVRRRH